MQTEDCLTRKRLNIRLGNKTTYCFLISSYHFKPMSCRSSEMRLRLESHVRGTKHGEITNKAMKQKLINIMVIRKKFVVGWERRKTEMIRFFYFLIKLKFSSFSFVCLDADSNDGVSSITIKNVWRGNSNGKLKKECFQNW